MVLDMILFLFLINKHFLDKCLNQKKQKLTIDFWLLKIKIIKFNKLISISFVNIQF